MIFAPIMNPSAPTSTTTPGTTITQVSNGNQSQPGQATNTQQSAGSGVIYLIVLFLAVLIILMVIAFYLFNRKPAPKK